jgi:dienelactone hydrolase
MILVSKTYWAGMPFWFRRAPEEAAVESLALRAHDLRQFRALYWTHRDRPRPKVGVVVMHPRVDFTHHYAIPRLVKEGFSVLAANTRYQNEMLFAEHEPMVLDVAACVRHLREKRGVEKVVLLGNCGGGSLSAFYQAQACLPPTERLARTPGGGSTHFEAAPMAPADGIIYVAPHRGQGKILLDAIDPSVVDEADPLSANADLDMYDRRNGFREPPEWSEYDAAFLRRYRDAQTERVRRLDRVAFDHLARHEDATKRSEESSLADANVQRDVLRQQVVEPVMVVYRTMANPAFVDRTIDPSGRDYGSLLSERPDLMNYAALGLARTCTARAWLSTWSGLSSNADLVGNAAHIPQPTLVVHAGRDREIFPSDRAAIDGAIAAKDKRVYTVDRARHYFEPDPEDASSGPGGAVEALMDLVVPWIAERFS